MAAIGKTKIYEETFVSPFEKETEADAFKVLEKIREAHNEDSGWFELDSYVEQLPNGKWRAVRRHAKYAM